MSDGRFASTRIALIYDDQVRPDTTGGYCLRALEKICQPTHVRPKELYGLEQRFDLFLNIDDSFRYLLPAELRPAAFWVIDTHLQYDWDLHKARSFDWTFAAQKNGAERLAADGVEQAAWLPLACDPEIHRRDPKIDAEEDVVFVGNIFPGPRKELLEAVAREFPKHFIGQAFFREMAERFSSGKILVNQSIKDDVNMRVFEGCACGRLLITNDLRHNGQEELLQNGRHLVTFDSIDDALGKLRHYLAEDEEREAIAAAGAEEVRRNHTYARRMEQLLETAGRAGAGEGQAFSIRRRQLPLTSVLVLAHDQEKYNRMCVESIRRYTRVPYELILIDNGSKDGTLELFRSVPGAKVVENGANLGFAGGFNRGIEAARGDYVVLLNNDTLVTEGWLEKMLAAFDADPELAVAGPMTNCISGAQLVKEVSYTDEASLQRFARERATDLAGHLELVSRITGFCMMISRSAIERIGTLDTRFGIGNFEDDDYCVRTRLEGFHVGICSDVFIHHFGSVTFRASKLDYGELLQKNQALFREKWTQAEPPAPRPAPAPAPTPAPAAAAPGSQPASPPSPAPSTSPPSLREDRLSKGRAVFEKGLALHKCGELEAASEAYLAAAALLPDAPAPLERLGEILLENGAPGEAAEIYQRLVRLVPASAEAATRLGIAYARAGRQREAIMQLEKTACEQPLAPSERALILAWSADARLALGALGTLPDKPDLHDGLGRALVAAGKEREAIEALRRACELPGADLRFRGNLAAALWSTGERDEAFEILCAALSEGCDDPVVAENLATCALELERPGEALALLGPKRELWGSDPPPWLEALEAVGVDENDGQG